MRCIKICILVNGVVNTAVLKKALYGVTVRVLGDDVVEDVPVTVGYTTIFIE